MPDIFTRLKFFMIAPRLRRRGAPPAVVDGGYTVEPLVPLSDDEIAYRAEDPIWTLTEALFLLSGYKPPGYESTHQIQDHFWPAYNRAWKEIKKGTLCKEQDWAGERVFIDTPENWLAWADRIGAEDIEVDDRMRRALSQMADTPDGAVKEEPQPDVSKAKAVRPSRRGRKKGSGGYDSEDAPLVEEMHRLIGSGEASGTQDAALAVADRAPGKRRITSTVKRLVRKYAVKYPPDEGHSH